MKSIFKLIFSVLLIALSLGNVNSQNIVNENIARERAKKLFNAKFAKTRGVNAEIVNKSAVHFIYAYGFKKRNEAIIFNTLFEKIVYFCSKQFLYEKACCNIPLSDCPFWIYPHIIRI